MLKLMGASLVIVGAAMWGLGGVMYLRDRAAVLRGIAQALETVRCEVTERLTPLPELFAVLKNQSCRPVGMLFSEAERRLSDIGRAGFSELWSESVEATPELLLREDERTALVSLGCCLGRYGSEWQGGAIESLRQRFVRFAELAEEELRRDSRTKAVLSAAAGMTAVIILI